MLCEKKNQFHIILFWELLLMAIQVYVQNRRINRHHCRATTSSQQTNTKIVYVCVSVCMCLVWMCMKWCTLHEIPEIRSTCLTDREIEFLTWTLRASLTPDKWLLYGIVTEAICTGMSVQYCMWHRTNSLTTLSLRFSISEGRKKTRDWNEIMWRQLLVWITSHQSDSITKTWSIKFTHFCNEYFDAHGEFSKYQIIVIAQ